MTAGVGHWGYASATSPVCRCQGIGSSAAVIGPAYRGGVPAVLVQLGQAPVLSHTLSSQAWLIGPFRSIPCPVSWSRRYTVPG